MKQHMVAFGGLAQDYSAGNVTVPNIADPLIRFSSNVMQLTDDWMSVWSFFGGVGLTKVRLSSASTRIRGYPNLTPFAATDLGGDLPKVCDHRDSPLLLKAGENVTIQATNGGAQATIGLLQLGRGDYNLNVNASGLRKIRFTATVTGVAFGFSQAANVVLDDDIEYGTYDVYGWSVFEAATLAARLIFKDQVERPGVLANQAVTDRPWDAFYGGLGLLGSFQTLTPPFIENIANAAGANNLVGYLYCAKRSGT